VVGYFTSNTTFFGALTNLPSGEVLFLTLKLMDEYDVPDAFSIFTHVASATCGTALSAA
jgi:hypothetical protein